MTAGATTWTIWGNRTGWLLAGGVAAVVLLGAALIYSAGRQTGRTALTRDPAALRPLELPTAAAALAPAPAPGDGSADLRRALTLVGNDLAAFERFVARGRSADLPAVEPALALAREAAEHQTLRPLAADAAEVVAYPTIAAREPLRNLAVLGRALLRAGLLREKTGDAAAAGADFRAAFRIGRAMFRERLVWDEARIGLAMMVEASGGLADGGAARAALGELSRDRLQPIAQALTAGGTERAGRHVGDALALIDDGQEPMWRREAVFALARQRFNAARHADRAAAEWKLKDLAESADDPLLRAAAAEARDLSASAYRTTRVDPL